MRGLMSLDMFSVPGLVPAHLVKYVLCHIKANTTKAKKTNKIHFIKNTKCTFSSSFSVPNKHQCIITSQCSIYLLSVNNMVINTKALSLLSLGTFEPSSLPPRTKILTDTGHSSALLPHSSKVLASNPLFGFLSHAC